jgi:hypothetical protein
MKTPGKIVRADNKSEVFKSKGSNNESFNDFDDDLELEDFSDLEDLDDFDDEDDDY